MPLHRDIHWLGRQWAVTGHGLQLINQKQMGYYDIEAVRLWEARVTEVQTKAWIDRPDFDKALEIARGKFAHLAPADLPAPAAVAPPLPPVRATPPAAPRTPRDAESVPSIEELLARLKSKSATAPLNTSPAETPVPAPPKSEPRSPEPQTSELRNSEAPKVEPAKSASRGGERFLAGKVEPSVPPKSELPKAPRPELLQTAAVAPEPPRPGSRAVEPPRAEPAKPPLAKPDLVKREAPNSEPQKPEPLRPEAHEPEPRKPEALKVEVRNVAPAKKLEAPMPTPVVVVNRRPARPAWPVFDRKIAGSGRFVQPWRVTSARWHGPGLPPRP